MTALAFAIIALVSLAMPSLIAVQTDLQTTGFIMASWISLGLCISYALRDARQYLKK